MTLSDQHAELKSWIVSTAKEIRELVESGKVPLSVMEEWIQGRLWEFTVVHGMVITARYER